MRLRVSSTPSPTARRTQTPNIQHFARRVGGMSHAEVARALGVDWQRVTSWVALGWLEQEASYGLRARYATYTPDAVSAFLMARGGLLRYLHPVGAWIDEVHQARAALHTRYISRAALCKALYVTSGSVQYWIKRKGFPSPALRFGHSAPTYFERTSVRAWLKEHDQIVRV